MIYAHVVCTQAPPFPKQCTPHQPTHNPPLRAYSKIVKRIASCAYFRTARPPQKTDGGRSVKVTIRKSFGHGTDKDRRATTASRRFGTLRFPPPSNPCLIRVSSVAKLNRHMDCGSAALGESVACIFSRTLTCQTSRAGGCRRRGASNCGFPRRGLCG